MDYNIVNTTSWTMLMATLIHMLIVVVIRVREAYQTHSTSTLVCRSMPGGNPARHTFVSTRPTHSNTH